MLSLELNSTTNPGADFDNYVNGKWKEKTQIPEQYNRWGSFDILRIENQKKLKELLNQSTESNQAILLWKQGNNIKERNSLDAKAQLQIFLKNIHTLTTKTLSRFIINYLILNQLQSPFSFYCYTDLRDSCNNVLYAGSFGLTLPDRDYYFAEDKQHLIEQFKQYVQGVNNELGLTLDFTKIFSIEKELAAFTKTKTEKRDPEKMYHPMFLDQLKTLYPSIDWNYLFKKISKKPGKVVITNPEYFKRLDIFLQTIDLSLWKDYLTWCVINSTIPYLNQPLINLHFNFYEKAISGAQKIKDLEERVLNNINSHVGEIIGEMYCNRYFTPEAKSKTLEMIGFIKEEFKTRFDKIDWMDETTKIKAIEKLSKFKVKIGYPDKWKDYSSMILLPTNTYLNNIIIARRWESMDDLSELYEPVDKTKWHMHPHVINAYYSPTNNEIVFPAGILQKPFFSFDYDAPLNFGAIGCVIAHEITHGFDDQGRKFDGDGNLKNWWSDKSLKLFNAKTKVLEEQFSKIKIEDKFVNGKLTLGENIADLGGVIISFNALQKYATKHLLFDKEGFTPNQRFFFSYAKLWKNKMRQKELEKRLITDVHAPPFLRINQILKNIEPFYQTFEITADMESFLSDHLRCKIW